MREMGELGGLVFLAHGEGRWRDDRNDRDDGDAPRVCLASGMLYSKYRYR